VTKLLAVLISLSGVAVVSLSDFSMESKKIPLGTIFALISAFFYASYLVFLRKKVDHEDKLDIPMFFGFVGLFNLIILWPLFFILHYAGLEEFSWPTKRQWLFLVFNGIIGTVFSEVLWLWGCFLTSSLIATLAISLTIPLSMIADVLFKNISYSPLFYLGTAPMVISFFVVNMLAHYENWDPVMNVFSRIAKNCFGTRNYQSVLNSEDPQSESLISVDDDDEDETDTGDVTNGVSVNSEDTVIENNSASVNQL
jgi:solute carrier family 35 protein F5